MKNRKGFTLVELLAVLVIMGIVIGISIPAVTAVNKRLVQQRVQTFYNIVEESADAYVEQFSYDFDKNSTCYEIPYNLLITDDFLREDDITCLSESYGEASGKVYAIRVNGGNSFTYEFHLTCYDKSTSKKLTKHSDDKTECIGVNGSYYITVEPVYASGNKEGQRYNGEWTKEKVKYNIKVQNPYFNDIQKFQYGIVGSFTQWLDNYNITKNQPNGEGYILFERNRTTNKDESSYKYDKMSFRSVDMHNNISSEDGFYKLQIDNTEPVVEIRDYSEDWVYEPQNVTIDAINQPPSGIDHFTISYGSKTEEIPANGNYSIKYTVDGFNGEFKAKAISNTGIECGFTKANIKVDSVTPEVSLAVKMKNSGTAVNSNTWSKEGLNFILTKTKDGISGSKIYYCKDTSNTCNPTDETGSGSTITRFNNDSGTYYFRYKIVSGANKSSEIFSFVAKVDTATPAITLVANKSGTSTRVNSGIWSNKGLDYIFTSSTAGTSPSTIYYCKDNNNTCNPTTVANSGTTVNSYGTTNGVYYIRYKVVSAAGLSTSVSSFNAKVDSVAPTCTINKTLTNSTSGVNLTVNCDGTGSSCSNQNDTGLKSNKTYTVTDEAGNTGTCTATITSSTWTRNQTRSCNTWKRCSSAGCDTYNKCANSACGCSYYYSCQNSNCSCATYYYCQHSQCGTEKRCNSSSGLGCDALGGNKSCAGCTPTGQGGSTWGICTCTLSCRTSGCGCQTRNSCRDESCGCEAYISCRTSGCGCETYSRGSECGCETYSDWSNWSDWSKTACSGGDYRKCESQVRYD